MAFARFTIGISHNTTYRLKLLSLIAKESPVRLRLGRFRLVNIQCVMLGETVDQSVLIEIDDRVFFELFEIFK